MVIALLRDQDRVPIAGGQSSADSTVVLPVLIDSSTGRVLVLATGAVSTQTPTGTVDGANVTFTFTSAPTVIVVDQGRTMKKDSGWSLTGLVVTLDVAPTFEIYGIY